MPVPSELHDLFVDQADELFPDNLNYTSAQRALLVTFADEDLYTLVDPYNPGVELGDAIENAINNSQWSQSFGNFRSRLEQFSEYCVDQTQIYYGDGGDGDPWKIFKQTKIAQAATGAPASTGGTIDDITPDGGTPPAWSYIGVGEFELTFDSDVDFTDFDVVEIGIVDNPTNKAGALAKGSSRLFANVTAANKLRVWSTTIAASLGDGSISGTAANDLMTSATLSVFCYTAP